MEDDPNDQPEQKGRWIKTYFPPEFLQEAAKRGVPPEFYLQQFSR